MIEPRFLKALAGSRSAARSRAVRPSDGWHSGPARHLARPTEAKKTLANLFAAPGAVDVRGDHIRVTLQPAGSRRELDAFARLLAVVNRRRLTLPGDRRRRPLRFHLGVNHPV